jgi:DNA repair protein RadC
MFASDISLPSLLPRERMWNVGTHALVNSELLAVLLGTGVRGHPASAIATDLIEAKGGIEMVSRASPQELTQITGIGAERGARVAAAFELGRRVIDIGGARGVVRNAEDAYAAIAPRVCGVRQELFFAIGLDPRNRVIDIVEIARGTLTHVEVHPRELFRPLIRMAAAAVVLAHNHTSGDPTPSEHDIDLTYRLRESGFLLGIPIIDHVVIGEGSCKSIAEYAGFPR